MKNIGMSLLLLTVAATGTVALAQGDSSGVLRRTEFFSDASHTNLTGEFVEFCDGTSTLNGQPDIHSRLFEYSC